MKFQISKNFFKNQTIFITGGTGSFGKNMVNYLIKHHKNLKKIIIFSRDELKQFEMSNQYSKSEKNKIRFFRDIRDKERLKIAFRRSRLCFSCSSFKTSTKFRIQPYRNY